MDYTEVQSLEYLGDDDESGYYKTEDDCHLSCWYWDGESYDESGEEMYECICTWNKE